MILLEAVKQKEVSQLSSWQAIMKYPQKWKQEFGIGTYFWNDISLSIFPFQAWMIVLNKAMNNN